MKKQNEMETLGEIDESRYTVQDEALLKETAAYQLNDVSIILQSTESAYDFKTGGKRKRRYALVMSVAGIPNFNEMEDPVMLQPSLPKIVIDGDSLDVLLSRAHAELDVMFNLFEDTVKETNKRDE